ncbi:MAG: ATP-dependent RNA helicase HrpA [Lysobacterales bacterium]
MKPIDHRRRLQRRLGRVPTRQWPALQQQLKRLDSADEAAVQALESRIDAACAVVEQRLASTPALSFDESLPMVQKAAEFERLLQQHQVVVVAGATGCGKSTQLPKLCLRAGRGARGLIGVTQPRRIAARSLARRVAQELNETLGQTVGFQVRFQQQIGPDARIKFMTDGIALAETQGDRDLRAYDTLIIDEVHERSLNIDFLLGYLQRLLRRRPDLKLVLASATLDTGRFAAHFGGAPVLQVEGRGFPVEIRHRPLAGGEDGQDLDLYEGIAAAIGELDREDPRADILVFLPGEREIRDAHRQLERAGLKHSELLPLYGRLSAALQDRVFQPGPGRRIVLATNVAETSLTVPRVKFVIDSGLARVNRYSPRTRVQRLQVEPISQAAAAQRAGRCGRTSAGICVRLYSDLDAQRRPEFTDPELLRSSLAGVILAMLDLRLGDPASFPFIDPPSRRLVHEGWEVLFELGAVDGQRRLTEVGRQMARLPIDVRLARLLIAAQDRASLSEGLIIASALSIQDPRERPADRQGEADQKQAVWKDERSDFLAWINLWQDFEAAASELTVSGLRGWCADRLLSYPRMREWRELHRQLKLQLQGDGWSLNAEPASFELLHQAILTAFVSQVGERTDKQDYRGPRGRRFRPFPASALARSGGRWVMAAQLLETRQLYGLQMARIDPRWIEPLAGHLLERQHYEAHWDADQAQAWCYEDLLLYGLPIVRRRRVRLAPLDPAQARELFLRHGLVRGEWRIRHPVLAQHRQVFNEAQAKEEKLRRRGLLRDELEMAQWFDARLPAELNDGRSLLAWLRRADESQRQALRLQVTDLLIPEANDSEWERFPDRWQVDGLDLPLRYHFDPKADDDGVTLRLPLADLQRLPASALSWLVPGLREDKVVALIKGLPKALRRNYVPAPDFARAFLQAYPVPRGVLEEALAEFLSRTTGVPISAAELQAVELPTHLRLRLELVDGEELLAQGRDLDELRGEFHEAAQAAFQQRAAQAFDGARMDDFPAAAVPTSVRLADGATAWPALQADGDRVRMTAFADADSAAQAHRGGVLALLRARLDEVLRYWRRHLPLSRGAQLQAAVSGGVEALSTDIVDGALADQLPDLAPIRDRQAFQVLVEQLRRDLGPACSERATLIDGLLCEYGELRRRMVPPVMGYAAANLDDLATQLQRLFCPGFARRWSWARLQHFPRYLKAAGQRLDRLLRDAAKDQQLQLEIAPFEQALTRLTRDGQDTSEIEALRWAIEEYRVSIFAQSLGTDTPVSAKRLQRLQRKAERGPEAGIE